MTVLTFQHGGGRIQADGLDEFVLEFAGGRRLTVELRGCGPDAVLVRASAPLTIRPRAANSVTLTCPAEE